MHRAQVKELLLQALEHERGGVEVYATALKCAVNRDLKREWQQYFEQTQHHVQILNGVFTALDIDLEETSPGRAIVRALGGALVEAMNKARATGNSEAAQLVACECVVLAETKDHLNWELIEKTANNMTGREAAVPKGAAEEVEDQEDEHLYHSKGWCRELWIRALGMPAVLPPPEEEKHVKTAIGAARAEMAREQML